MKRTVKADYSRTCEGCRFLITEPEEIAAMRHTLDEYHKVADPLLLAKAQGRLAMLLEGSET